MPRGRPKKETKKEENQPVGKVCPNCKTVGKMSVRQVDTDRDGAVVADIYACSKCQAWLRVPKSENKNEEIERLKKRLQELGA